MPQVSWEGRWSDEALAKQLPSLHGIVSKYTSQPDVIGMHGGLPPSDAFPFTSFSGRMCHDKDGSTACDQQLSLDICDLSLVTAAQQYNMAPKGYAPLVSWARAMVEQLHQPATLKPVQGGCGAAAAAPVGPHGSPAPNASSVEPIGMDVIITSGSSAALDSLVRMLLNPGNPILLEEFTYAHIVEAHLLPMRIELLPVALDGEGLVPSDLDRLMNARQAAGLALPRVLYTIPTGQNPTGSVMRRQRMEQVYALAQKWDLVLIEDDAYFWLQYPDGPDNVPGLNIRPGFLSLDTDGRVIRLDTLAKLLGPGYRLGWLAGPPELAAKFSLYTAGTSIGANMLSQVFIHQLLQRWGRSGFETFVSRLQQKYARQAQVAAAAAAEHLSGLAEWQPVRAGMFMWCKLSGGGDSAAMLDAAAAEKVMVVPGHLISVRHLQAAFLRKMQLQEQASQQKQHQQQLMGEVQAQLAGAAADPSSTICSSSSEPSLKQVTVAAQSGGAAAAAAAAEQDQACQYFRVSFVSVGPDDIREGFVRLKRAIPNCHSEPKTPPAKDA